MDSDGDLVLAGELRIYEKEGGFCAPEIEVDGVPIDRAILAWRWGNLPKYDRQGVVEEHMTNCGQVCITIKATSRC